MDTENKKCDYICSDREWYLKFLQLEDKGVNQEFVKIYLEKLKKVSSDNLIKDFLDQNLEKIIFFNNQFLSETSKKDKVLYKGM